MVLPMMSILMAARAIRTLTTIGWKRHNLLIHLPYLLGLVKGKRWNVSLFYFCYRNFFWKRKYFPPFSRRHNIYEIWLKFVQMPILCDCCINRKINKKRPVSNETHLLLDEFNTFSSPFWTPKTRKQHTITVSITTPGKWNKSQFISSWSEPISKL